MGCFPTTRSCQRGGILELAVTMAAAAAREEGEPTKFCSSAVIRTLAGAEAAEAAAVAAEVQEMGAVVAADLLESCL